MKLNLGCGKVYKPGYVNVDSSNDAVADENWDIMALPLNDSSVDLIEMDQVIEHFDWVNVRYLLAECWRVLRPGGKLVIETPDLLGTMKRMKRSQGEEFLVESQWLFGINTKGQRHGIVFKEKEIQSFLISSGFVDIRSSEQQTYLTEPGMRIECAKGKAEGRRKVESLFRKRLRKLYNGDSYILIPVEDLVKDLYFSLTIDGEPREPLFSERIFRSGLVDPEVPGQMLMAMQAYQKGLAICEDLLISLKAMHDNEIKSRAFTLWMKRRKGADIRRSFQRFTEDLSSRLSVSFSGPGDHLSDLDYLFSLEPTDVRMLDFRLIADRSLEWLSKGIKDFFEGDLNSAYGEFERSNSAIPNPTALWNISRIDYLKGKKAVAIKKLDKVMKSLSDRSLIKEVKREQEMMRRGTFDIDNIGPRTHVTV